MAVDACTKAMDICERSLPLLEYSVVTALANAT
jgi:hypothetical protein